MSDRSVSHATFALERTYPVPPERVFDAWADPAVKVRWFAGSPDGYELDFRPGGIERNANLHDGQRITWESLYREIVVPKHIVYTSVLAADGVVATVSLTTVELSAEGEGARLVLVEAGAYLDGHELPEWREQGTGDWLDALVRYLSPDG